VTVIIEEENEEKEEKETKKKTKHAVPSDS
jgi:hypothetical protein